MADPLDPCCGIAINNFTLITHSPLETHSFGRSLGENMSGGEVIALYGELGAGKTCMTQGIARGLGVPEEYPVTSPTFTIINEYPGRLALCHIDMYRLSGVPDLEDIGYESCLNDRSVMVVEWADKIRDVIPDGALFVLLTYINENTRKIMISDDGEMIDRLFTAMNGG